MPFRLRILRLNRRLGNLEAQFEQLALNLAVTPTWILIGQTYNQLFHFLIDFWTASLVCIFR